MTYGHGWLLSAHSKSLGKPGAGKMSPPSTSDWRGLDPDRRLDLIEQSLIWTGTAAA